jgi:UDP-N-acetylglucosamine 2-epimerase (non-hydrolysing)
MHKILTIFGTRPEAIKLAPIIKELSHSHDEFESIVGVTGQHDKLLKQVLDIFKIRPSFNLKVMRKNQNLTDLTALILKEMGKILDDVKPDLILVQGDTTTVFATALAAFYRKIRIGHVEAGLRTEDKYQPFPEEINRRLADQVSDLFFAPTEGNMTNLIRSGIQKERIYVTGNTVVDALLDIVSSDHSPRIKGLKNIPEKMVLITAHRRENFGEPFKNVFNALQELSHMYQDFHFVYPVHPNPNVHDLAYHMLSKIKNIHLIEPIDYFSFIYLMKKSYIVLTDSGGIQEEAPTLNKPVLILREKTERGELVDAGGAILVGTNKEKIIEETAKLISSDQHYKRMSHIKNPFGDGNASLRIVQILKEYFLVCQN